MNTPAAGGPGAFGTSSRAGTSMSPLAYSTCCSTSSTAQAPGTRTPRVPTTSARTISRGVNIQRVSKLINSHPGAVKPFYAGGGRREGANAEERLLSKSRKGCFPLAEGARAIEPPEPVSERDDVADDGHDGGLKPGRLFEDVGQIAGHRLLGLGCPPAAAGPGGLRGA